MIIKDFSAKSVLDSRKEKTISITIKTNVGNFSASSPSGSSTGKYEKKPYKKNIEEEIKTVKKFKDYFSEEDINVFEDLRRIEDILDGFFGANTFFALESAILKALAKEKRKEIWQIVNPNLKKTKFPRLVGNCIGGGKHQNSSSGEKKPDFQEFLLIPKTKLVSESFLEMKKRKKEIKSSLEEDKKFRNEKNYEDAFVTSLNEKEVLEILKKFKSPLGVDIASSSFYKRKKYHYENPMMKRDSEEQMMYLSNLIKNFNLFYIEDPFQEDDFEGFSKLLKKFPDRMIVGDDLTTTSHSRLKKAIEIKSINAVMVKPNQIGSLIEVKEVCELAKKNNIKIVFSHRSGETDETILADLAFGFQADFFKSGITGNEREFKIKRLIDIERGLK